MKKELFLPMLVSFGISSLDVNAQKSDPNLLLIFLDDTGWGTFAPNAVDFDKDDLNQEFIKNSVKDYTAEEAFKAMNDATPTLNRICNEGVRFRNGYVTANVSSPSRVGLLTSSYQQRYGLYINQEAEKGVPEHIKMMPQILQENGYVTGIFGKYHNGNGEGETKKCGKGHHPLERGFDRYFGFNSSGTDYYESNLLYKDYDPIQPDGFLTDQITNEAIEFIKENPTKSKLIYVPYNALHGPLGKPAPKKYLNRFNYNSKVLNNYAAYLAAVDNGVKEIMNQLKQQGELENTMIIFLSDNGAPGGAASTLPKNGPFSGFKGQSWQGGVRVPFFVWYGEHIKQSAVSDAVVSSMDIFPTVMDYANITLPTNQKIDGKSMKSALTNPESAKGHDHLVWMSQHALNWGMNKVSDQKVAQACYMVREGKYLLRYAIEQDEVCLYDIENDRAEKKNIAEQHPKVVKRLQGHFKDWFAQMQQPNDWDAKLWQNVKFWDPTIPAAEPVVRDMKKKKKRKTTH